MTTVHNVPGLNHPTVVDLPILQQEGQFELELKMSESGGVLGGRFKCDTDLFEEGADDAPAADLRGLLALILANSDRPVSCIVCRTGLSPAEDDRVQSQAREEIDL